MPEYGDASTPRTRPNYLYSITGVALVLFLLGFFALVLTYAQRVITVFKERVNLLVELQENVAAEEVAHLEEELNGRPYFKAGSFNHIDKEEAAELMRDEFGDSFLKLDLPNPFYDVVTFNVQATYMHPDSLSAIQSEIRKAAYVNEVYYQENLVSDIARNLRKMGYAALGVGLFFIFVAVTLIHNTIRLALYSNRFLIKNMELVGASWGFISRPYLWRALLHGLLSGLLAITALAALVYIGQQEAPELRGLLSLTTYALLFAGLMATGVLINTMSTYWVVNKYLKMRVDDLY